MMSTAFLISSAVALIASGLVVSGRNPVHALLYLVVSLLAVALMLFLLGAPFAAALEVIIYAGAIMVLFLFVVMMTEGAASGARQGREQRLLDPRIWIGPSLLAGILLAELSLLLALGLADGSGDGPGTEQVQRVEPTAVGIRLLGPYLLAVELASMLLLAGLIGAWHLGQPVERTQRGAEPSAHDTPPARSKAAP